MAGVLILALALAGCDVRLGADAPETTTRRSELIETHSLARTGVTLGGAVLGPVETARTAGERARVWSEDRI